MKTSASQKVKIGVFTLAGIAVLLAGIFVIGNKKNMFSSTFSIYGTFKNVGGLQVGNNIRFAGINVGTVEDIVIQNDTTVRVDMVLQSKVRPFIKSDAMASIGSDGLMGDKLIVIAPGANGDKLLAGGGEIQTKNPVDFDKMIARITHIADNAEIITASLADITTQISSGKGSLGRLIYTDNLEKGLTKTVQTANETVQAVHETMKSVKKGTEGFSDNMDAIKHNVLLKGYFKKKDREKAQKVQQQGNVTDSTSTNPVNNAAPKETRKQRRKDAREEKKAGDNSNVKKPDTDLPK
jgi:phospholipid/cholesterol/gamma-HCH transport system substrate-binding protein